MDLCVATSTFYQSVDDLRFSLALQTLEALREQRIPVVVVDGSPPNSRIREKMILTGAYVFMEDPGSTMGASRRLAIKYAVKMCDITIWMEPEKWPLVPYLRAICAPIVASKADIVVPRRADNLASYPAVQRFAEQCGNAIFAAVTGLERDVWIGPRAMNKVGVQHFRDYDGKYGDKWHSIFMPLLTAHKAGLRIGEVEVDFQYPPEQAEAERVNPSVGIDKRLEQLLELGKALVQQAQDLGLQIRVS